MPVSPPFHGRRPPGLRRPILTALCSLLGISLLASAVLVSGAKPVTAGNLGPDDPLVRYGGAPAYPGETRCGAAFALEGQEFAEALAREDRLFGRLGLVRVFYGDGPPEWRGSEADIAGRSVHVSFKFDPDEVNAGRHDARLRSWFRSIPADRDVYWTYFHEPEDNIEDGEFSAAEYRSAWRRVEGIADQAGNRRLHATLTLMQWTLEPASGRQWLDYYPGRDAVDVLAWDVYNSPSQVARGEYTAPAELLGEIVRVSNGQGLPWSVSEFGSHLAEDDDGERRAAWLREATAYAAWRGALYVSYFDLDWSTGDYRLRDEAGIFAWRAFCD